ncbi:MAG: hypothetical protein BWY70_00697 [Bacteroidetes bacterium ADurb.Bin408]|nr:MAG: hypothetical protein BWY70_00697 [Bacteroidetes bacterium ADurb.Bin408]
MGVFQFVFELIFFDKKNYKYTLKKDLRSVFNYMFETLLGKC